MNWNYIGIDPDPPKRTQVLILTYAGQAVCATSNYPHMAAWSPIPEIDEVKQSCQSILGGLPELRMIACILGDPVTKKELVTALVHYRDDSLAAFTDLVRALDRRAHHGVPCIADHHR